MKKKREKLPFLLELLIICSFSTFLTNIVLKKRKSYLGSNKVRISGSAMEFPQVWVTCFFVAFFVEHTKYFISESEMTREAGGGRRGEGRRGDGGRWRRGGGYQQNNN